MTTTKDQMRVTLVKSPIGCNPKQRECVLALGLRKLQSSRIIEKTSATIGLVRKVHFLVKVEEV